MVVVEEGGEYCSGGGDDRSVWCCVGRERP